MGPRLGFFAALPLLVALGLAAEQPAYALPPAAGNIAAAQAPHAQGMAERARAFAQKHKLPVRTVEVDVGGRKATRIFVPVTEATHDAFVEEFTTGAAIIRQRQGDTEHVQFAMGRGEVGEMFARLHDARVFEPAQGGRYLALELDDVEKAHFKATMQNAQDNPGGGGCMKWLLHGCIAPDRNLAHKFGIKRSTAPSNMVKKLLHSGNDLVVVGVPISSQPEHARQLRQNVHHYEQQITHYEQQITQLEAQGGGRVSQYRKQLAPYTEALEKIDAAIALRAGQKDIVDALRAKKTDIERAAKVLNERHEQPFKDRMIELESAILVARANVKQAVDGRSAALAQARANLAFREKQRAELARLSPAQGATAYDRRVAQLAMELADLDTTHAITMKQTAAMKAGPRAEAKRATYELQALAKQVARKAGPTLEMRVGYDARIAELDASIENIGRSIQENAGGPNFPARLDGWRTQLTELRQEKARLVEAGVGAFNPRFTQRLAQLDAKLQEQRQGGARPEAMAQLTAERDALLAKGPSAYNPEFDQRVTALEQYIVNLRLQLAQLGNRNDPQVKRGAAPLQRQLEEAELSRDAVVKVGPTRYDAQLDAKIRNAAARFGGAREQLDNIAAQEEALETQHAQTVAQKRHEREGFVARGAAGFDPVYEAEIARIDAQIAHNDQQIAAYQPHGAAYQHYVQGWQAENERLRASKLHVVKNPNRDNSNEYQAKLQQVDTQIQQAEQNAQAYAGHGQAYAAHAAHYRTEAQTWRDVREALTQVGPQRYDPKHQEMLEANAALLAQARTALEAATTQHEHIVTGAKRSLEAQESLRAEVRKHGATVFNPAWEQAVGGFDQQIAQYEQHMAQHAGPEHAAARAQWLQAVDGVKQQRAALLARGPADYNPHEPQIQAHRQAIQHIRAAVEPLKAELAAIDAAANAGNELVARFNALPEATLMGPPPGGGAAEAVRH